MNDLLMFILKLTIVFIVFLFVYCLMFRKWIFRKYTFELFVGKPGCGKSTLMTKEAVLAVKKGKVVYSNVDIEVEGVRVFNAVNIGLGYCFELDSLVLIDEPNLYWDNRQFKSTKKETIEWFRIYRHNKVSIKMYTQTFDIDKKLRALASDIYIVKKYLGTISIVRRLNKQITIKQTALDAESQIVDELNFVPIWIPNSIRVCFIPKWTKYFDSFSMPNGEPIPYVIKRINDDSVIDVENNYNSL